MASYTKLRDGSWGLRIQGTAKAGQTVKVSKKDGSSKTETVARVLWTGEGITLATIANGNGSRYSVRSRGGCRECGGPVRDASHHRAMGGLCGECAFDEYDM